MIRSWRVRGAGSRCWSAPDTRNREAHGAVWLPILDDADTGHLTPLQSLPIGVGALLDSSRSRFAISEPAVR
jgi:hypothetical protein